MGMMIGRMHDGAIVVNYVTPGGPAELAGVRSGQRLLAVDDVGVHGMRVAQIHELIKGPAGSAVAVSYTHLTLPKAGSRMEKTGLNQTNVRKCLCSKKIILWQNTFTAVRVDRAAQTGGAGCRIFRVGQHLTLYAWQHWKRLRRVGSWHAVMRTVPLVGLAACHFAWKRRTRCHSLREQR